MIFVFIMSAYHESFNQFFQLFSQLVLMFFEFKLSSEIKISVVTSTFFNANEINEFSIIENVVENAFIILDNSSVIARFFSETCTIFKWNSDSESCHFASLSIMFLFCKHLNNVWWSIYSFMKNLKFYINYLISIKFLTTAKAFLSVI